MLYFIAQIQAGLESAKPQGPMQKLVAYYKVKRWPLNPVLAAPRRQGADGEDSLAAAVWAGRHLL